MFVEVHVIQCKSTGEFMTSNLSYSIRLQSAGLFTDKRAAVDTAVHELHIDFTIYSFYLKETNLPLYASLGGTDGAENMQAPSVPPM